jgi:outer membrane lipoprotein-sorting protein
MEFMYKQHFGFSFTVIAFLFFFGSEGFSQSIPMDAAGISRLKSQVKEAARKTNTITSEFSQEKEMGLIAETIRSGGKFYFKKEKMLRWEYLHPYSYLIVIRNDQVSIKDDQKVNRFNVQSNKIFTEINRVILGSVQGTLLEDEKNFLASYFENRSAYIVKLQTLAPKLKETLAEIVIYFDRSDFTVNRIDMNEAGGDFTRIRFTTKKLNQPTEDEMFVVN